MKPVINTVTSASFTRLVDSRWIKPELQSLGLAATARELTALVQAHPAVLDAGRLDLDIRKCLEHNPVGLLPGLVFPHVRTPAVGDFVLAVGRSARGISLGGDDPPVRLVFLLASPVGQVAEHLAVIAGLARQLTRPGVIERLLAADDAEQLVQVLQHGG